MSAEHQPIAEIRLGSVKASIFANALPQGGTVYRASTCKIYKTAEGTWKRTNSYSRDELLLLAEAARAAFHLIADEQRGTPAAPRATPPAP